MNQELKFLEKLRELKGISVGNKMTDDQIRDFFGVQELSSQQLQMIRDYLAEDDKNEDELSEDDREYLEEFDSIYSGIEPLDTSDMKLYQKLIDGDRYAFEKLAAQYMTKVLDVARAHKEEGVFLGDLVSEGSIGLTEGLTMVRGPENAHEEIMAAIRKSIRLYLMERDAVRTHDNSIIEKVQKMDEALNFLKVDLGRKVYIEEVADYMGITEEEVGDILKLTGEDVEDDQENIR